jgi:predicted small lipoprotein YifL
MFRPLLISTLILTSLLITGCGQKGPLYLPKDKPLDAAKPAHIKQAHRAVAVSKKQQAPVKKASAVKLDEKNPGSVDNSTNLDVKPESKTNSGTIHVSGS